MALYKFKTRNNIPHFVGYQLCDNCGFMKPCVYADTEEARLCGECVKAAIESFTRLNKAKIKPKELENEKA